MENEEKITVEEVTEVVEETATVEEVATTEELPAEDNAPKKRARGGRKQKIETIENADDWSTYISIYVDDVESQVGIASIEFTDGMKISLKLIENPYA